MMNNGMRVQIIFAMAGLLLLLAACVSPQPTPEITPRPSETPTLQPTLAPTATPLPTFTPTPTAQPLVVADYVRNNRLATPVPQRGAPCGVVDVFDFPLDAPEANNATARWIFGRYSERYSGIHAGEDWVYDSGGNLGQPVYSIGHGTVLYAQPLGWGVDQGTIIIRHVLPDGHTILSFYGHLEPDSVVLQPGACVQRGEQIGRIGKPRGQPHLHFEIRTIFPDQPGPGYWSVDPTLAGWKPPSEYIWDERVQTSPGVKWTRPFTYPQSALVGLLISDTVAAVEDDRLIGLATDTGRLRWSLPLSSTIRSTQVADTGKIVYLLTMSNTLQAVDAAGTARWEIALPPTSRSSLLPQTDGVSVYDGARLIGYSADGLELWRTVDVPPPAHWFVDSGQLLFTTAAVAPALYRLAGAGQLQHLADLGGRLTTSRDHLFVYAPNALYRLSETPEVIKTLDRQMVDDGSLITTWDGTIIVAHHGASDLRLMAFNPDGSLRWENSIASLTARAPELIKVGRQVYAATAEGDLWWIDAQTGEAQRVLDGQRVYSLPGQVHAVTTAYDRAIIDFRGGRLIAIDPQKAVKLEEPDNRP